MWWRSGKARGAENPDFNIVQGPRERIDSILYCEILIFREVRFGNKIDYNRIICHSSIEKSKDKEYLCYSIKIFGSIFSFLSSKFLIYNNMAYHETSRAADVMMRNLLEKAKGPLQLVERTKSIEKFQYIDEWTFLGEALTVPELREPAEELLARKLLKAIDYGYNTYAPPDPISQVDDGIRKHLNDLMRREAEERIMKIKAEYYALTKEDHIELVSDTPYEMRIVHPDELQHVKIVNRDGDIIDFKYEAKREAGYDPFKLSEIRIWRIYANQKLRKEIEKLKILERIDPKRKPTGVDSRM